MAGQYLFAADHPIDIAMGRDDAVDGLEIGEERLDPLPGRVGVGVIGARRDVGRSSGIISYDPVRRTYSMRSYAMGYAGDFPLEVRPDGYSWTQPLGPGASVHYTATVSNGEWHEVGDRVAEGSAPTRIFEMRLRRVGAAPGRRTIGAVAVGRFRPERSAATCALRRPRPAARGVDGGRCP